MSLANEQDAEKPVPECVLRTLNLCDGQVLEESDRELRVCACALLHLAEDADTHAVPHLAAELRRRRADALGW